MRDCIQKGTAILVRAWVGLKAPGGWLRFSEFFHNRHTKVVRLSALDMVRFPPPPSVDTFSTHQGHSAPEGLR